MLKFDQPGFGALFDTQNLNLWEYALYVCTLWVTAKYQI